MHELAHTPAAVSIQGVLHAAHQILSIGVGAMVDTELGATQVGLDRAHLPVVTLVTVGLHTYGCEHRTPSHRRCTLRTTRGRQEAFSHAAEPSQFTLGAAPIQIVYATPPKALVRVAVNNVFTLNGIIR